MDATPNLVTCDWCKCQVGKDKLSKHKTSKCPNAPAVLVAARTKQKRPWTQPKRQPSDPFLMKPVRVTIKNGVLTFVEPETPTPDRLPTTPSSQDRQINPHATVTRVENGVFHVSRVLASGGTWNYPLEVECKYCHRIIKVNATGPSDMQQFAKDEACRLALLEHLRIDDARPYHSPAH